MVGTSYLYALFGSCILLNFASCFMLFFFYFFFIFYHLFCALFQILLVNKIVLWLLACEFEYKWKSISRKMARKKNKEDEPSNALLQHREAALSKVKASLSCSHLQIDWQSISHWFFPSVMSREFLDIIFILICRAIEVTPCQRKFMSNSQNIRHGR